MKFKLIFILFNILIIGSFAILFFMPAFLVGWDFAGTMWVDSWYLPILFLVFIGVLNFYFIFNWRLFTLLEGEKWKEILDFLDDEFFKKSGGKRGLRLNRTRIRIYINACVVSSNLMQISKLADFLKEHQIKLFADYVLTLGLPQLLKEDPEKLEAFYGQVYTLPKVKDASWCIWIHSFAQMLQKKDEARKALTGLVSDKDPLIKLLSLYLIGVSAKVELDGDEELFYKEKASLKEFLSADKLSRIREKQQGNMLFYAMSKIIDQAWEWLHQEEHIENS
ncbi:MAG: hypothetical protein JEY99_13215 [Spirochaetales bacterium]|nr:hypothetical protein [Spirochaetales bacterium]